MNENVNFLGHISTYILDEPGTSLYMHYSLNFLLVLQLITASSAFSFLLDVTFSLVQVVLLPLPLNLYKLGNDADCH